MHVAYLDVFANLLMVCLIFVKSEFEIFHILVNMVIYEAKFSTLTRQLSMSVM